MTNQTKHTANDRLIAAAPELLDSLLSAMQDTLETAKLRDPDQYGLWDSAFVKARAVIAKATGAA